MLKKWFTEKRILLQLLEGKVVNAGFGHKGGSDTYSIWLHWKGGVISVVIIGKNN